MPFVSCTYNIHHFVFDICVWCYPHCIVCVCVCETLGCMGGAVYDRWVAIFIQCLLQWIPMVWSNGVVVSEVRFVVVSSLNINVEYWHRLNHGGYMIFTMVLVTLFLSWVACYVRWVKSARIARSHFHMYVRKFNVIRFLSQEIEWVRETHIIIIILLLPN